MLFCAVSGVLLLGVLTDVCAAQSGICASSQGTACVTTWHNDDGRTGQNLSETTLTPGTSGSVATQNFGKLCSAQLDGQVWAQPLVLSGVPWGNVVLGSVVYVVTMNDTLYAIDGTPSAGNNSCQILASLPFLSTTGLPTNGQQAVNCSKENWLFHNTPAYWESAAGANSKNYLYVAPTGNSKSVLPLFQYTLCTNGGTVCGTNQTPAGDTFPYGATPSISASAPETATDGIVWAIANGTGDFGIQNPPPTAPAVLYAFDALDVSQQLYASSGPCTDRDRIAPATKFSVPTVANGHVYVGAQQCTWKGSICTNSGTVGTFYIFGLNAGTCN